MPPSSSSSWSQFPAETSCKLTTSYIGRCVSPPVCERACALHPCGLQRKWMLLKWSAAKSPGQLLTPNPLLFIINLSLFLSHLCSCPLSSCMGFLRESGTLCLPLDCPSWIQFKKKTFTFKSFFFSFRTDKKKEHSAESICKKWDSIQKAHKVLSGSSSVCSLGMLTLLCWATKPSLNLAFYHFPSRITLDISAAIQLLSSRKLPLPVIYISQSPSASFPLSPSSKHKHGIGSEDFDAGIQEISSEAQQGSFRLSRARWWCDWGFLFLFICPNCVWAKPVVCSSKLLESISKI